MTSFSMRRCIGKSLQDESSFGTQEMGGLRVVWKSEESDPRQDNF
jgi:hypothetical protein